MRPWSPPGSSSAPSPAGRLAATSVILLLFYVKNYIDTHARELGILKALGYSNMQVARHFWVFGGSILAGCLLGLIGAFLYMPQFYALQNTGQLLPRCPHARPSPSGFGPHWHPHRLVHWSVHFIRLHEITAACFGLADREKGNLLQGNPWRIRGHSISAQSQILHPAQQKKVLVFFVFFSAFCFSSMTQMSMSMGELSSGGNGPDDCCHRLDPLCDESASVPFQRHPRQPENPSP